MFEESKVYETFGKHNVVSYEQHPDNDAVSLELAGNDYDLSDFKRLEDIFGTSDISMTVDTEEVGVPYDGVQTVARIHLYIENII